MRRTRRSLALIAALALGPAAAYAGPPTQSPASNPAHPVWDQHHGPPATTPPPTSPHATTPAHPPTSASPATHSPTSLPLHPAANDASTGPRHHHKKHHIEPASGEQTGRSRDPVPPQPLAYTGDAAARRRPAAEAAYRRAGELLAAGAAYEAVEQLDLATELDPTWSAPVRLRAETFGRLAQRHDPSEALLTAQATDLERLLVLEPAVDAGPRRQQAAALRLRAVQARAQEQRRRELGKPALIVGSVSGLLVIGGALMLGLQPSAELDVIGQRRNLIGGIAMLSVGAAAMIPAISLGVLARRQHRRDAAVTDLGVQRGQPLPTMAISPRVLRGGAGLGLALRF